MDILEYGWRGIIVAVITCVVIELIKAPVKALIKKKTNSDTGKVFGAVAFCVSAALGALGAVIFSLVFHAFDLTGGAFYAFILWVISVTQFLYAMYEKLGFREALKKLLAMLIPALKPFFDETPVLSETQDKQGEVKREEETGKPDEANKEEEPGKPDEANKEEPGKPAE